MIKRISDDKLAKHAAYSAYNAVEASTLAGVWECANEPPRAVIDFLLRDDLPSELGLWWGTDAFTFRSSLERHQFAVGIRAGLDHARDSIEGARAFTVDGSVESYTIDDMYPDDEPHQEVLALEVGEVVKLNLGAGGRTVIQRVS